MRYSAGEVLLLAGIDRGGLESDLPLVDPSRVPVWGAPAWFRVMWAPWVTAVTMPWGIYVHPRRLESDPAELGRLMVHELAHLQQWRRLGVFPWVKEYLGSYLRGRRSGLSHREAYLQIPLEEEARELARRHAG